MLLATSALSTARTIGTSCTNYENVSIVAPGAGTVVVWVNQLVSLNHVSNKKDRAAFHIDTAPSGCASPLASQGVLTVAKGASTDTYESTLTFSREFTVAAGAGTFHLNGIMTQNGDASDLWEGATVRAYFHPS